MIAPSFSYHSLSKFNIQGRPKRGKQYLKEQVKIHRKRDFHSFTFTKIDLGSPKEEVLDVFGCPDFESVNKNENLSVLTYGFIVLKFDHEKLISIKN